MIDHRLTAADAKPLATLHRRAFPGFFLSHLGEPFLRQFYLGFVDDETAVTVVARDELGEPYGVTVGTTHPAGFFSRLLLRRLMGFVFASAAAVLRDPRTFPRIISAVRYRGDTAPGHDGALLSSICVYPAWSGGGVRSTLLSAWRHRAYEMGARFSDN